MLFLTSVTIVRDGSAVVARPDSDLTVAVHDARH
jgi:hypothetical protein